ncbi:hypothetical protein Tco_0131434 [Tanacetum coccineum]
MPNVFTTHPSLYLDSDFAPSDDSLGSDLVVSFPSETRNKIFDPRIFIKGFNPLKIISDFSESPMMISGGDIPILDVPIALDFEDSRNRGFVLRSLELQSLA